MLLLHCRKNVTLKYFTRLVCMMDLVAELVLGLLGSLFWCVVVCVLMLPFNHSKRMKQLALYVWGLFVFAITSIFMFGGLLFTGIYLMGGMPVIYGSMAMMMVVISIVSYILVYYLIKWGREYD